MRKAEVAAVLKNTAEHLATYGDEPYPKTIKDSGDRKAFALGYLTARMEETMTILADGDPKLTDDIHKAFVAFLTAVRG